MADLIRYVNIGLTLLIAGIGTPQLRRFMRGGKDQIHWLSSILFNLTALIAASDALRRHVPPTIGSYLTTIALAWLLATVCYRPAQAWRKRHQHLEENS